MMMMLMLMTLLVVLMKRMRLMTSMIHLLFLNVSVALPTTFQLCVKDGLASPSSIVTKVIAKAAKVVNHIKKSTLTTEKMETLFGKTVVSRNETRWNSELKTIRRLVQVNTDEVVERPELMFTSHEKVVMKELVQILEPFKEATDLTQKDQYVSVSLVIPSVVGLQKHLHQVEVR